MIGSRWLTAASAVLVLLALLGLAVHADMTPGARQESDRIEIWHGTEQKVGHLGDAQPDFNLMGSVDRPEDLLVLQYAVNDGIPVELNFGRYRRIASLGHFNADIPLAVLNEGVNTVELEGRYADGSYARKSVTLTRAGGDQPLPLEINWRQVSYAQDVGQYVDGQWRIEDDGLRTAHMGYDRIFLIGNRSWQDYEVTATVTIHDVAKETDAISGTQGLGLILRFAGHLVGGHFRFPEAQPKWGFQPFGAIAWLRWLQNKPFSAPFKQYFRGDSPDRVNHDRFDFRLGQPYVMKALCQTLPDDPSGEGVTRYAFKIWPAGSAEPLSWDWEEVQVSAHALRRGGVGLVAHFVDASFADISITPLKSGKRSAGLSSTSSAE